MRSGDIVSEIKRRVDPSKYDFSRAEGRADFDDALREQLREITDPILRAHASQMIKEWRRELFD